MTPDFCTRCGKPTKLTDPDPEFCGSCGFLLISIESKTPAGASVPDGAVAKEEPLAPASDDSPPAYSPYPDLDAGTHHQQALALMMARYTGAGRPLPLSVGVIIDMGVPVQCSLPLHRDMNSQLSDPGRRPLPFNLMTNWRRADAILWKDVEDRHISRAGAIAYYWGGDSHGKMWHFKECLDERVAGRLVTTDDSTIDFEIRLKPDMRDIHEESGILNYSRVFAEGLPLLEKYLAEGISTKGRRISSVGTPIGWAMFGMDELAPQHRSQK